MRGGNEPRGGSGLPQPRQGSRGTDQGATTSAPGVRSMGAVNSKELSPVAHPPGFKSLLSHLSLSSSPAPHHLAAVNGAFTFALTGHGIFTAAGLSWTPKMLFACRRLG